MDRSEEVFDYLPENKRGRYVLERDCRAIAFPACCVLKVRVAKVRMVLVLVPASVNARIRVAVVDAKPIVWRLPIPLDNEFGSIRSSTSQFPGIIAIAHCSAVRAD